MAKNRKRDPWWAKNNVEKAQEFAFKAGARLFELPTDEVVADTILYLASALLFLAKHDQDHASLDLAIKVLKEVKRGKE